MAHHGARLRVGRAEHDGPQTGVDHRSGAHRTRLERDVERALVETPVPEVGSGVTECEHLGVRHRVAGQLTFVVASGDDLAAVDHRCTDGDIVMVERGAGLVECPTHPPLVLVGHRRSLPPRPRVRHSGGSCRCPSRSAGLCEPGGEGGIRTHGMLPFTRFPSVPIRPLSHPSRCCPHTLSACESGGDQAICGTQAMPMKAATFRS